MLRLSAMAKNAIGMAIACEEYGAKFFVKYTLDPWAVRWQIQNSLFRIHPVVITRRIGGNYSPSTIYPTKPTKYIDMVGNKW